MLTWPDDHPVRTDPALAPYAGAAEELIGRPAVITLLRHLPGRRATSMAVADTGPAVLKVFAGPRARGNHRRLTALTERLGALVPHSHGTDPAGHVSLLGWQRGVPFDELDDEAFVDAAAPTGAALAALHTCGADLDRTWTLDRELEQLQRRATDRTGTAVADLIDSGRLAHLRREPLVPSHRDAHPRQIVVDDGRVAFIDLDDAALAPAGLDVGNFVAHLRREAALGRRTIEVAEASVHAFLTGYGTPPPTWEHWQELSLLRLIGLAESRHARVDWAVAIEQSARRHGLRTGRAV